VEPGSWRWPDTSIGWVSGDDSSLRRLETSLSAPTIAARTLHDLRLRQRPLPQMGKGTDFHTYHSDEIPFANILNIDDNIHNYLRW
jgi:hypothetical protein